MDSYNGDKNYLIKHPYNKVLFPIKLLIDILQSSLSSMFRFMNFSSIDSNFNKFVKNNYQKGLKILDFGSGFGNFAKLFDFNDYLGIEINHKYISKSRKLNSNYNFLNINLAQIKLDRKYDLVIIYGVLHHIPNHEVRLILDNIKNSLEDRGKIYIYEPLPPQSLSNIKSLILKNLDLGNFIRTNSELISLIPDDFTFEEFSLIPNTDHIRLILKK
jgi:2-polyprenyl-3-methyl-5-hydroxy-6-metoxy-1,4-benzoquinol methylase